MEPRVLLLLCNAAWLVAMTTAAICREYETFNTALSASVTDSETRMAKVIQAVRSSPSDVICLQEVWMEEELEKVIKELSPVFPHHFSALHESKDFLREPYKHSYFPLKDKPCSAFETTCISAGVGWCGWWNGCLSKSGYALGECLTQKCASVFNKDYVSAACVSCIFMNALNSLKNAITTCSLSGKYHNRLNAPGLLLMSKQDLGTVSYEDFYPDNNMTLHRGYIQAQIDGDTNVVCTHLSSNLAGYIEYDADFSNYKDQQTHEIEVLDSAFSSGNTILLGDLNTGPRVTGEDQAEANLGGEFPDNYDLLESKGFSSPYVKEPGLCTYCNDNPLTNDYPNQILDHVMVKPSSLATDGAHRVYNTTTPPISDHYGVRLSVCT